MVSAIDKPRALISSIRGVSGWRRALLAFAGGALAAFAFPPFGAFPLLWLSLPLLIVLLDGAKAQTAQRKARFLSFFCVSWAFFFGFFLVGLFWIAEAFLVDAKSYAWMIPIALFSLPGGLALIPALMIGAASLFWGEGLRRILVFVVVLVLSNWVRGHILSGFPWNVWGYAFAENLMLMQSFSALGIYGVGFLVAFLFSMPVVFIAKIGKESVAYIATCAVIWAGLVVYGVERLQLPQQTVAGLRVLVIQPNVPQADKWKPENRERLLPLYLQQTKEALSERANTGETLIFWPESAFPFLLDEEEGALEAIGTALPEHTTLITGGIRREISANGNRFFNSTFVVSHEGALIDIYDKVRLVPFGEYLPMRWLLQSIGVERLVPAPADFTAGAQHEKIDLNNSFKIQPLICYEAIFPQTILPESERPNLLVNLTNDGWFGETAGPYQHFAQARVRAVEQGVPLVRAANTGISGLVDSNGRILAEVVLNKKGSFDGELPKILRPTLYVRVSDSIFWGIILLVVSLLLVMEKLLPTRRD
ncbi:Apolipoprotein N-acyltransferase [Pseudovibrio axinellae]|uniref:Apolipoprotein N-acyltransferase n=1 Tax=Pseudovibrio axinellae TaxID=989403 RepID=A0A165Z888_9HYPH|nr:apolipoprotein N-acyltransferase [Pseudovibrio axinellae]KZL19593.1 Apolipoprotein N-acyltransferase [Pseudovibrio axinellae]SEQ33387.1 Apolipoprotein N-acyltransferase [Pseudovibrio axinellae]